MKHLLSTLARDRAAVAMTEFALATPLMLTAILGGVEMTHYISTTMRVEQVEPTHESAINAELAGVGIG